jgi:hypothetical protein
MNSLKSFQELYKDLTFIDDNGYHWIPSTVNLPDKGMVYVNGTNKDNWKWTAVPAVEIPEDEKTLNSYKRKKGEYHP